eukprot:15400321-Alexandrium_andersonii.AAC.1
MRGGSASPPGGPLPWPRQHSNGPHEWPAPRQHAWLLLLGQPWISARWPACPSKRMNHPAASRARQS